jgi:ABC-2 type transport system permease protein
MIRIFDITLKDMLQMARDRKIFMFLLVMPVLFTLLFGYAFGGFGGGNTDTRLPVGYLDADGSWLSEELYKLLNASGVIRLDWFAVNQQEQLETRVIDQDLVAAIIVPPGYGRTILDGKNAKLILFGDASTPVGTTVKSALLSAANRLDGAVRTAIILEEASANQVPFDYAFEETLAAWEEPPITVNETTSSAIEEETNDNMSLAHTSPGMMLQFAIAGLLTSAQIIVAERKSHSLQRMLTTATKRVHILFGHLLAIFAIIFAQFLVLMVFGQYILNIDYLRDPFASGLVAFTAALCIAALGLLIGTLAKSEEQAVIFALIPMFVFAGLGGAWVPLEVTGSTFQAIGHVSPVAWAMDGFKNVSVRGLGLNSVLLPAAALVGYALLFFGIAAWRFQRNQEK